VRAAFIVSCMSRNSLWAAAHASSIAATNIYYEDDHNCHKWSIKGSYFTGFMLYDGFGCVCVETKSYIMTIVLRQHSFTNALKTNIVRGDILTAMSVTAIYRQHCRFIRWLNFGLLCYGSRIHIPLLPSFFQHFRLIHVCVL